MNAALAGRQWFHPKDIAMAADDQQEGGRERGA